ncbi:hypothetical protein SPBRAN_1824 [uncultured Candidatus Thioglobus sp.]|nr:hypothetical protein SPBRAN_1824 [uncultured Candidatus Thioglobus sp.]
MATQSDELKVELLPSKKFIKDLDAFKKSAILKQKIAKTLALIAADIRHPGLNLERIVNDKTAWSIRVDRSYRISLEPLNQDNKENVDWGAGVLLLRILNHDDLYKSPH